MGREIKGKVEIKAVGGPGVKVKGNVANGAKIKATGGPGAVLHLRNSKVHIDTLPVGLSMLCLAYAKKQLTRREFELAVEELVKVTNRYKEGKIDREIRMQLFNEKWRRWF